MSPCEDDTKKTKDDDCTGDVVEINISMVIPIILQSHIEIRNTVTYKGEEG